LEGAFYRAQGGKGANQAVAAARASRQPVTFVAAVGDDDLGVSSVAALAEENLVLDFLKTVPGAPSGVALIMVDGQGQNMISVASGANLHLMPADVEALPEEIFRAARVLLVSLEIPIETVGCALARAKRDGLTTILNPAPASREVLDCGLLRLVDVLTPNEGEAEALSGTAAGDRRAAAEAARVLHGAGPSAVIVTRGAKGCVVLDATGDDKEDEKEIVAIDACRVKAVDTTAAGDAFSGALAVALAEGTPAAEAGRWANRAAALAVTQAGAQSSLPTRDEIDAFHG
jgi:ribokinase